MECWVYFVFEFRQLEHFAICLLFQRTFRDISSQTAKTFKKLAQTKNNLPVYQVKSVRLQMTLPNRSDQCRRSDREFLFRNPITFLLAQFIRSLRSKKMFQTEKWLTLGGPRAFSSSMISSTAICLTSANSRWILFAARITSGLSSHFRGRLMGSNSQISVFTRFRFQFDKATQLSMKI